MTSIKARMHKLTTIIKKQKSMQKSKAFTECVNALFIMIDDEKYRTNLASTGINNEIIKLVDTVININDYGSDSIENITKIILLQSMCHAKSFYSYTYNFAKQASNENIKPDETVTLSLYNQYSETLRKDIVRHFIEMSVNLSALSYSRKNQVENTTNNLITIFFASNLSLLINAFDDFYKWPLILRVKYLDILFYLPSCSKYSLAEMCRARRKSILSPIYNSISESTRLDFRMLWMKSDKHSNSFLERFFNYFGETFDRLDVIEAYNVVELLEDEIYAESDTFFTKEEKDILAEDDSWANIQEVAKPISDICCGAKYSLLIHGAHNYSSTSHSPYDLHFNLLHERNLTAVIKKALTNMMCHFSIKYLYEEMIEELKFSLPNFSNGGKLDLLMCPNEWFYQCTWYSRRSNDLYNHHEMIIDALYENGLIQISSEIDKIMALPWGKMNKESLFYKVLFDHVVEELKTLEHPFNIVKKMKKNLFDDIPKELLSTLIDFEKDLHLVDGKRQLELLLRMHDKTPMDVLVLCEEKDTYKPKIKNYALSLISL